MADTTVLGSLCWAGTGLAMCGYTRVEARQPSQWVEFILDAPNGDRINLKEIDFVAELQKADDDEVSRMLEEWRKVCE